MTNQKVEMEKVKRIIDELDQNWEEIKNWRERLERHENVTKEGYRNLESKFLNKYLELERENLVLTRINDYDEQLTKQLMLLARKLMQEELKLSAEEKGFAEGLALLKKEVKRVEDSDEDFALIYSRVGKGLNMIKNANIAEINDELMERRIAKAAEAIVEKIEKVA